MYFERHVSWVHAVTTQQQKPLQLSNLQQQNFLGFQIQDLGLVHKNEFRLKQAVSIIALTGTK